MGTRITDRRTFFRDLSIAIATMTLLPRCREPREFTFEDLSDRAIYLRTEDKDFTPQMFDPLHLWFDQTDSGEITGPPSLCDIDPFLPLINATYFDITGEQLSEGLKHLTLSEEEIDEVSFAAGYFKNGYLVQEFGSIGRHFLREHFHELGHAYDHLVLGRKSNELTSELFDLVVRISLEKNRPPRELIVNGKEGFLGLAKKDINLLFVDQERNVIVDLWQSYLDLNEQASDPKRSYKVGRVNAAMMLAKGGSIVGALFELSKREDVDKMYEKAEKSRSPKKFYAIVDKALDVMAGELISSEHGNKVSKLIDHDGNPMGEYNSVERSIDYLRDLNVKQRDHLLN